MKVTKKLVRATPKRMSICNTTSGYDQDFFKWTKTQASLLKKKELEDLDIVNLIEEIESLGRNDKRSLRSHLVVLLTHLLKIEYQSEMQGNSSSWESPVKNATRQINVLIEDSPSLKNELKKVFFSAYQDALEMAAIATRLPIETFPEDCPWTLNELFRPRKK